MSKHGNQMAVRYKPLQSEKSVGYKWEASLDTIFSPGNYVVEVDHNGADVGLPIENCGEEHYIVGNLAVTDSGTTGPKQHNRVIGQVLTFTSRKEKETKIYVRTFADGEWGVWHAIARVGMFSNIKTTDELVATVSELVNATNILSSDIANLALEDKELCGKITNEVMRATTVEKRSLVKSYAEQFTVNAGKYLPIRSTTTYIPTAAESATATYAVTDVMEGEIYDMAAVGNTNFVAWAVADSDGTVFQWGNTGETIPTETTLVMPENAAKLIVNCMNTNTISPKLERVSIPVEEIPEIKADLSLISEKVGSLDECLTKSFSEQFTANAGKYLPIRSTTTYIPTAAASATATYAVTDVVEGEVYNILGYGGNFVAWAIADCEGTVFQWGDTGFKGVAATLTMPENAATLIVNCLNTSIVSPKLERVAKPMEQYRVLKNNLINNNNILSVLNPLAGKKMLCLGDSITEFSSGGMRYSDHIAKITGAVVYNGGIGGAHMEQRASLSLAPTEHYYARAALDLPTLVEAITTGDWSYQDVAVEYLAGIGDDNSAIIAELKTIDLSEIDIVTIFIGTNDTPAVMGEVGSTSTEIGDSLGGLYRAVKALLEKNPALRIYYFSPMPRYFGDNISEWNDAQWCDNYTYGNGMKFSEMVDRFIEGAKYWKIPVCDMYRTLGINQFNIASVMKSDGTDGTHPYRGFKMIANRIVSFINANNCTNS